MVIATWSDMQLSTLRGSGGYSRCQKETKL